MDEQKRFDVIHRYEVIVHSAEPVSAGNPVEAMSKPYINIHVLLKAIPQAVLDDYGIRSIECTSPKQGGVVTELDANGNPIRRHEIEPPYMEYVNDHEDDLDVVVTDGEGYENTGMAVWMVTSYNK